MGPLPFALSVSHFISSVGSDAGFAAIVGLAVLVLLYFAQARETASLREQAEQSAARVQQLEGRLTQLARAGQQPLSPSPSVPSVPARPLANPAATIGVGVAPVSAAPAPAVSAHAVPAPPAGVGAPALTAATRLIPTPAGSAVGGPAVATGAEVQTGAPAPVTPAGGSNGSGQPPGAVAYRPLAAPPPRPRVQLPAPDGARSRRPAQSAHTARGAGARWLTIGALVIGAVAIVVALLTLTSGGGTPKSHPAVSTPTTNAPVSHSTKPKPFNYASVTVAVLNGTPTSGLAGRVAARLVGIGYKKGTVATASDQTRTATVVAYTAGHRADALAVAGTLKLGSASVQPVDQTTQAVACPPPVACTATVVVTVGADLTTQ